MNETEKIRRLGIHWLLSLLLTIGLLMPVLRILHLTSSLLLILGICAVITFLLECTRLNRIAGIVSFSAFSLFFLYWLFFQSGSTLIVDTLRAATLYFNRLPVSFELIDIQTGLFLSVIFCFICFFLTTERSGPFPASVLCLGTLVLIWQTGHNELFPFFLPAVVSCMMLFLRHRNEGVSPLRLFPWTILLVVLSWFLTPGSGLINEDLKTRTDDLRQTISDTLFFTTPRNVFSISADGYYPQGINQLGGTAEPSEQPVMQVSVSRNIYLRGSAYNEYTGRNWINTTGGRRYIWSSVRWKDLRSSVFNEQLPASDSFADIFEPVSVSIRMIHNSASTLFLPQRIRQLHPGGNLIPYFNSSSQIFITRDLEPGDTYTVSGLNYVSGEAGLSTLIDACSSMPDPAYSSMTESYTSLPGHLEQPVYDLALTASGNVQTPYEKAIQLQNWLLRNYRYSLQVNDQPDTIDFVTNFLINTKEGYCTYFASAMTILCRMIGLPARYIEGYLIEPDETGNAVITGKNAHAWTEVYFSGFGWVVFDATPRSANSHTKEEPQSSDPPSQPSPNPDKPDPTPAPTPDDLSQPDSSGSPDSAPSPEPDPAIQNEDLNYSSFSLVLFFLILLIIFGIILRIYISNPEYKEKRATDNYTAWLLYVIDILDLLHISGFDRRDGESPMGFMRRCDQYALFPVSIEPLGQCISLIFYAHVDPVESDITLFHETTQICRSSLPFSRRLLYLLYRALIPIAVRKKLMKKNNSFKSVRE